MLIEMPFDLVALVRCFFGRLCASSNTNLRMRSTPVRVKTDSCSTNSRSVPPNSPPMLEYSPLGVFPHDVEVNLASLVR